MAVWEIILSRESCGEVCQHNRGVNGFFSHTEPSPFQRGSRVSIDVVAEHQILEKCSTHPQRREEEQRTLPMSPSNLGLMKPQRLSNAVNVSRGKKPQVQICLDWTQYFIYLVIKNLSQQPLGKKKKKKREKLRHLIKKKAASSCHHRAPHGPYCNTMLCMHPGTWVYVVQCPTWNKQLDFTGQVWEDTFLCKPIE